MTKLIAIKGMTLPKNCFECVFVDESGQYYQIDGKALVPNILCTDIEAYERILKF